MTVRWKPLLILSAMFFVVAVVGVIAMALTLVPRSADGVLKQARGAVAAGRFDDAVIYFKQALQFDAKSASVHEEFANLYHALIVRVDGEPAAGPLGPEIRAEQALDLGLLHGARDFDQLAGAAFRLGIADDTARGHADGGILHALLLRLLHVGRSTRGRRKNEDEPRRDAGTEENTAAFLAEDAEVAGQ